MCLGFECRAAGWWVQMKPRSYGGRPMVNVLVKTFYFLGQTNLYFKLGTISNC